MIFIKRAIENIHLFMVNVAKLLLISMTLVVSTQVFFRYVLGKGLAWAEESALLTMIWFCFISLAIGVKSKLHICIEAFTGRLPEKVRRNVLDKISDGITLIIGLIMVINGFQLAQYGMSSTLPATGLPTAVLYAIIPVSGVLVTYDSFMDLFGFKKVHLNIEQRLKGKGEDHA